MLQASPEKTQADSPQALKLQLDKWLEVEFSQIDTEAIEQVMRIWIDREKATLRVRRRIPAPALRESKLYRNQRSERFTA